MKPRLWSRARHFCFDAHSQDLRVINKPHWINPTWKENKLHIKAEVDCGRENMHLTNRHLTKFHRTPGAVSHHAESTGVSLDSVCQIVGPFASGPHATSVVPLQQCQDETQRETLIWMPFEPQDQLKAISNTTHATVLREPGELLDSSWATTQDVLVELEH